MWAKVEDGSITEIISHPKTMTIDGITHPRAIFSLWTAAEKKAIGILPVTMATPLNTTYYTPRNPTYAIEDDGNSVTETIAKAGDKTLANVQANQLTKIKLK